MRVLVVDDNRDVAQTAAMIFEMFDCQVEIESDPTNVLARVKAYKPDLIIMDIGMPKINGYQLCRDLREHGLAETTIIAHTGWGSSEDKKRAEEAGFDDVLVKPVSIDRYQEVVIKNQAA